MNNKDDQQTNLAGEIAAKIWTKPTTSNIEFNPLLAKEIKKELGLLLEEIEVLRLRLVACDVGALSNTRESVRLNRIGKESPYYSAALDSVYRAVDAEIKYREALEEIVTYELRYDGQPLKDIARQALGEKE